MQLHYHIVIRCHGYMPDIILYYHVGVLIAQILQNGTQVPERTMISLCKKNTHLWVLQNSFHFLVYQYRREVEDGVSYYISYCNSHANSCMFYRKSCSCKGHQKNSTSTLAGKDLISQVHFLRITNINPNKYHK